jgi:hypothetical protein
MFIQDLLSYYQRSKTKQFCFVFLDFLFEFFKKYKIDVFVINKTCSAISVINKNILSRFRVLN